MKTILVALMVYVATKISHLNTGEFHENIFPKIVDGVLESILIWPILYVRTGNFQVGNSIVRICKSAGPQKLDGVSIVF